ncbi:hypothetical protein ACTFPQ_00560 [Bacillus cereus group sp. MYBK5-1]|uniref:hypothetical protein n=1 Tax=Bacillus cereus group sp. MYBK5-1 TaxID=3450623 RepID=UPI003F78C89E
MYINGIVNYLGAWEELNEKYPEEYLDIISALENIKFPKAKEGKVPYDELRELRLSWELLMEDRDWSIGRGNRVVGQKKNMTTVRLILGMQQVITTWLFTGSNLAIKNDFCEIPILILPMEEVIEVWGERFPRYTSLERVLSTLEELSPLSLNYPFLVIGISEQEKPLEIFNISSDMEGHNENIVMNRSIEFPPEYYQAGLGILSYFHKVLKEKYPGVQATIRIIQDGLVVKMIVETKDGDKHIVEKALEEYDLILKGEIKPEEYFGASMQIQMLELKSELRMAQVRIESQKELLSVQQNQINVQQNQINVQQIQNSTLVELISKGISKPALPAIHVSPVITVETSLSQQTIIHNELKDTIEAIRDLKQVVDSPETVESLNEIEEALSEADANNINNSAGVSKLQSLIETVNNTESTISKSIATTTAGIDLIKSLARNYNKLAPWCGLPQIPFIK